METLSRHDDLFSQEWITSFATTRELLQRDDAPRDPAPGSWTDTPETTAPYDSWDWLD